MVNVCRFKILTFILISCILINKFTNANPLQASAIAVNQIASDQTKSLSINEQNGLIDNVEENNKINLNSGKVELKDEDDGDDDKNDDKNDDKKEDKKEDAKENTKDDENKKDVEDKKGDEKEEKKTEESTKKIDEKLDDNQKETKPDPVNFDDSSQEEDSHSNPDTEEVGESDSESDEDDKLEKDEKELVNGKLEHKLLIILASGFRYDYIHIQKINAIKEILKTGVYAKVKPAFPSNSYPNYYALMTGLHPVKNGFVDDEMYDTKYKEDFPGKSPNHKHWWNKVEPLWITAMNNKIKVGAYWWKGACNITIKGRKLKNCVKYKEKVSNNEISKQLESIVGQFAENKLDLGLVLYEEIDRVGHLYGPESFKLRKAVRNFDKILTDLLKEIDEKNIEEKVNVVVVSDHGMASTGEKIDLEKFIDFNDIDKFVNTGTFAMILPEENKKDYIFNLLRSKIEGLNVYKKPDFPENFNFKIDTELILPIVLTTDKGYYIGEPSIKKDEDSNGDNDEPKKGLHGFHPLHVKEMNAGIFGMGPDFEKNHQANTVDQVDLYNIFCKLLKIKPLKNDGNKEIVEDFIHDASSEEHENDDNQPDSEEESGDVEDGYSPSKKKKDNLPVYRSRWALRGSASAISLNSSLQFIVLFITLIKFIRI